MPSLTLYTNPQSRGRIAHWMMEEVGQPYRTVWLNFGPEMKSAEYRAVNPMGKVPALRHGDVVVTEAAAIGTTALRARLLPKAPRIDPAELVELGERYARATGYPIQYQWTLIEGVNDSAEEIDGIVRLLKGKYALMNMIPYNAVPDLPYARPSWERAAEIARTLHQRGVLTKLRQSAGQDVDGGCGQLRARDVVQREQRVHIHPRVTAPAA